jgi:MtN3 and saliva related transmembrane protein
MEKEFLGWASSVILLFTLVRQVYKQWKEGTGEGVSKWLFAGQVLSSIGFTIYSYMVGNWVFTVTNAALLVNNFVGLGLTFYLRRKNKRGEERLQTG